jgi:hypothetical protein
MEQEAREGRAGFSERTEGHLCLSVRHDESINGRIRLPGGPHAYAP